MIYSKRGSLSLSINAIVVLILAITMLGLGLGFMRNTFESTTENFEDVSDDIKNDLIAELERSNDRLTFNRVDVEIERGEEKEIYYAMYNDADADITYGINFECTTAIDSGACGAANPSDPCPEILFRTFPDKLLTANSKAVMKVIIQPQSTSTPSSFQCKAELKKQSDGSDYASKEFFVTTI